MMVYRITVLSFLHPALMSDHWLLSAFNVAQNSSPKCAGTPPPPPPDESAPDTRQSRKQRFFFSVAALTTVKCDLFKTRYTFLRGGKGELKPALKGNMSQGCQASLHVFFLSHLRVISLLFLTITSIPCSQGEIHVNALSGLWRAHVGEADLS